MTGANRSTESTGGGSDESTRGGADDRRTKKVDENATCQLDPTIVDALYVEHGEELRRFLVGVLRDSQLANDALQATFGKLVEQGHLTREGSRKGWLFRVAYNEAMLLRRRDAVRDRALKKVAWSQPDLPTDSVQQPLVQQETVELVRAALHLLSPDQQRVVRMRIYEEKTFAVIARELKNPGKGLITLIVPGTSELQEVEIALPKRVQVNPQLKSTLASLSGVIEIETV